PIALTWPDLLRAAGAKVGKDAVEFKVQKAGSVSVHKLPVLPAIDPDRLAMKLIAPKGSSVPPPDYLSRLDKNFSLKKLDPATLYVQINQCVDERDRTLDQFAGELGRAIRTDRPRNLIVDVRLNNGGNSEKMLGILKELFAFEVSQPGNRLFVIQGRN